MDIGKLDPTALEFTEEEMDALAEVLKKAEQIKNDKTLHRLVLKHIDKKVDSFKSVDDLRAHEKKLAAKKEEADDGDGDDD